MDLQGAALVLFLLGLIVLSNYWTHELGRNFYKGDQKTIQVFDLVHSLTPDLHHYREYNDTIAVATIISFFFIPTTTVLSEILAKFLLIMALRSVTIVCTILPKHHNSEEGMDWLAYIRGHCYDKIFSGHTAFVFLTTLVYYREGYISLPILLMINVANMTSILLTRSHYTVDVILALFITYFIYNGDYHLFTETLQKLDILPPESSTS
jgi:hypothetical protein